jgi:phytoene dehydrogenase-like protein
VSHLSFYKDKYDAIVVGGGLSGMACAMTLASKGKDVLVLERHNLPGGVATSYVRNGMEIEASLHEMMSIGPEEKPLKIRTFFDEMGVRINWLRVPEAYHMSVPSEKIEITLHAGFHVMAKEIDKAYPGTYDKVLRLMKLCETVYESVNELSVHPMGKAAMLLKHEAFVRTCGYTAKEVLDTFDLPKEVCDILSAYWIYVAAPMDEMPFTVYAVLMADYFGGGSYVCRDFSYEMAARMAVRCEELGVQIEYLQEADKILVADGHVRGVRTKRGDEIKADYVACSSYPNRCYTSMIEPLSAVPKDAVRSVNARELSVTCFSVAMLLDKSPDDLGITEYSYFNSFTDMDTSRHWENLKTLGPYGYLTSICLNRANPGCTPPGMTSLSITTLPLPDGYLHITEDEYLERKRAIAREMIDQMSVYFGFRLLDHIVEIEIESPVTIAHYTGAWNGGIYGYRHSMDDHIVARLQMSEQESYIPGLSFCGAHAISGDGMAPVITNGRKAAKTLLDEMEKEAANA